MFQLCITPSKLLCYDPCMHGILQEVVVDIDCVRSPRSGKTEPNPVVTTLYLEGGVARCDCYLVVPSTDLPATEVVSCSMVITTCPVIREAQSQSSAETVLGWVLADSSRICIPIYLQYCFLHAQFPCGSGLASVPRLYQRQMILKCMALSAIGLANFAFPDLLYLTKYCSQHVQAISAGENDKYWALMIFIVT